MASSTLRAVITLEFIGEDRWAYRAAKRQHPERRNNRFDNYEALRPGPLHLSKPWVARIVGRGPRYDGMEREFLDGQIDYSGANSTGSRGVMLYYAVPPGLYEVNARETWTRSRRYFVLVDDEARMREVTRQEAEQWLRNAGLA